MIHQPSHPDPHTTPQLKRIARALYSNPPTQGARIAAEVINNPELFAEWKVRRANF